MDKSVSAPAQDEMGLDDLWRTLYHMENPNEKTKIIYKNTVLGNSGGIVEFDLLDPNVAMSKVDKPLIKGIVLNIFDVYYVVRLEVIAFP